eukprot:CAMPEP_0174762190 /NCGR_PEP_ID=MMETSP1094-20130205/109653_1 /TAXON_ID=156173 /ORGANISM="Chrysochromulina brevifilum, Strain UTEX LB 985" /LENGTH=256 /DNA_ID=CAMNT_0015968143 /DNA_START=49 /DNA_END=821 /DNA_ORIENTATION=+
MMMVVVGCLPDFCTLFRRTFELYLSSCDAAADLMEQLVLRLGKALFQVARETRTEVDEHHGSPEARNGRHGIEWRHSSHAFINEHRSCRGKGHASVEGAPVENAGFERKPLGKLRWRLNLPADPDSVSVLGCKRWVGLQALMRAKELKRSVERERTVAEDDIGLLNRLFAEDIYGAHEHLAEELTANVENGRLSEHEGAKEEEWRSYVTAATRSTFALCSSTYGAHEHLAEDTHGKCGGGKHGKRRRIHCKEEREV